MTTVFKSQVLGRAVRSVGVALAFAATFSVLSSTASFAFSAEAQQMCSGDAFRLCSAEIPNIPRITACMVKNRSQLSSGCRVVLDRDLAAQRRAPPRSDFAASDGQTCGGETQAISGWSSRGGTCRLAPGFKLLRGPETL
jgi:hypothetical protein